MGKMVCRRSLAWCVGPGGAREKEEEEEEECAGWLGHAVLLAGDLLQPKVCSPALIPVPGWGQPQPWAVGAGPTGDSHPSWGTERCPVLGAPCPPRPPCCQVCAGRVCPLLLPCPGQSPLAQPLLLTRGCPPALLRALNWDTALHQGLLLPSRSLAVAPRAAVTRTGLPHPAMGPVPAAGGGGGDGASACPFTPACGGLRRWHHMSPCPPSPALLRPPKSIGT